MATIDPGTASPWPFPVEGAVARSRLERQLPTLLSVIAGMVDLIGFVTLGNVFTAHVTGNLVVVAAVVVRGGPLKPALALALPVFILAVGATWLIAKASGARGPLLARRLLLLQFLLLVAVLAFAVASRPSAAPQGLLAGVAVMIAVSAMACQYALLRLAVPGALSTAVMTGNLTNAVLALLDGWSRRQPLLPDDAARLKRSLHLLLGFFLGCVVAAAAVSVLGDWAWSLPAALAGLAIALR